MPKSKKLDATFRTIFKRCGATFILKTHNCEAFRQETFLANFAVVDIWFIFLKSVSMLVFPPHSNDRTHNLTIIGRQALQATGLDPKASDKVGK